MSIFEIASCDNQIIQNICIKNISSDSIHNTNNLITYNIKVNFVLTVTNYTCVFDRRGVFGNI